MFLLDIEDTESDNFPWSPELAVEEDDGTPAATGIADEISTADHAQHDAHVDERRAKPLPVKNLKCPKCERKLCLCRHVKTHLDRLVAELRSGREDAQQASGVLADGAPRQAAVDCQLQSCRVWVLQHVRESQKNAISSVPVLRACLGGLERRHGQEDATHHGSTHRINSIRVHTTAPPKPGSSEGAAAAPQQENRSPWSPEFPAAWKNMLNSPNTVLLWPGENSVSLEDVVAGMKGDELDIAVAPARSSYIGGGATHTEDESHSSAPSSCSVGEQAQTDPYSTPPRAVVASEGATTARTQRALNTPLTASRMPAGSEKRCEYEPLDDHMQDPDEGENSSGRGRSLSPKCRIISLLALDGTWSQARQLYQALLHSFPDEMERMKRIHLNTSYEKSLYEGIRKEPKKGFVSTLEAVALCLPLIDERNAKVAEFLTNCFDAVCSEMRRFSESCDSVVALQSRGCIRNEHEGVKNANGASDAANHAKTSSTKCLISTPGRGGKSAEHDLLLKNGAAGRRTLFDHNKRTPKMDPKYCDTKEQLFTIVRDERDPLTNKVTYVPVDLERELLQYENIVDTVLFHHDGGYFSSPPSAYNSCPNSIEGSTSEDGGGEEEEHHLAIISGDDVAANEATGTTEGGTESTMKSKVRAVKMLTKNIHTHGLFHNEKFGTYSAVKQYTEMLNQVLQKKKGERFTVQPSFRLRKLNTEVEH
ncbi:unnamed protein product [Amoebophrya sp. A120]|nr:unnamed protein product [Amoebophrya sp. A120]|eukprot:GSA120T00005927001.1